MHSPLALSQLADPSTPASVPVAASPCTSPQRRTGATPHSPHPSVRSHAHGAAGFLGSIPAMPCACTCHCHATALIVPAPEWWCPVVAWLCVVRLSAVCPVRARAIGSFRAHDDDDTAFPQKRGEVLPYEAHHVPCTGACPPDGTRPYAIPPAPASPVSPELRPSTHLSSCPTCPRLTRGHAGRCDPM
jgi:hypothetical protein